jgi:hypothetical protein
VGWHAVRARRGALELCAYVRAVGIPVSAALPGTGPFDHVRSTRPTFDAVRARLEGQNVPVHVNVVPGVGLRQLFVFDPNGVKVEINIPA